VSFCVSADLNVLESMTRRGGATASVFGIGHREDDQPRKLAAAKVENARAISTVKPDIFIKQEAIQDYVSRRCSSTVGSMLRVVWRHEGTAPGPCTISSIEAAG
jgi:hypothetical protein